MRKYKGPAELKVLFHFEIYFKTLITLLLLFASPSSRSQKTNEELDAIRRQSQQRLLGLTERIEAMEKERLKREEQGKQEPPSSTEASPAAKTHEPTQPQTPLPPARPSSRASPNEIAASLDAAEPVKEAERSASPDELSCAKEAARRLTACIDLSLSATFAEGAAAGQLSSQASTSGALGSATALKGGAETSMQKSVSLHSSCSKLATQCSEHCEKRASELAQNLQTKSQECHAAQQQGLTNHPSCTLLPSLHEAIDKSKSAYNEICKVGFETEICKVGFETEIAKHTREALDAARMRAEAEAVIGASTTESPTGPAGEPLMGGSANGSSSAATDESTHDDFSGSSSPTINASGESISSDKEGGLFQADQSLIQACGVRNNSARCTRFKQDYCADQAEVGARPQMVSISSQSLGGVRGRGRGSSYCNQIAQKIWCDRPNHAACPSCTAVAQARLFTQPGCIESPLACLQISREEKANFQTSCMIDPIWAVPDLTSE